MEELNKNLDKVLTNAQVIALPHDQVIDDIKNIFKDAGYVRIPTGQNVTISTGDNQGGKLMTEQEWREKFSDQQ